MYGKRLKELRQQSGLSQTEFAEKYGTAVSTISGYENEVHEPPFEFLKQLCKDYDVSFDYILGTGRKHDYREFFNEQDYHDYADYISMGDSPEEASDRVAQQITNYGKMVMRLHYDDRRKVEQYVKELRDQGDYD